VWLEGDEAASHGQGSALPGLRGAYRDAQCGDKREVDGGGMSENVPIELNPGQQQAVDSKATRIIVMASPGSGKTRTLSSRIAHLVEGGVSPYQICGLTFTNKAASQLKSQVEGMIGRVPARKLFLGTFHSYCYRLLRSFGAEIGLRPDFTIYDENMSQDLLEECRKKAGCKLSLSRVTKLMEEYGSYGHILAEEKFPTVLNEYRLTLRQHNAMDFNSLLSEAKRLLEKELIQKAYQGKYPHFLIDEAQDISQIQHEIIELINPENLFMCGDIDQSIYEWRGAHPEILHKEASLYGGRGNESHHVIKLETCYRCPVPVAEAANQLIQNNDIRFEKSIAPVNTGPNIVSWPFDNAVEMNTHVARYIEGQVAMNFSEQKEFFVLARTNWQLFGAARALAESTNLSYQLLDRKKKLFSNLAVKAIIHALEIIKNPSNDYAAEHCIFAEIFSSKELIQHHKRLALIENTDLSDFVFAASGMGGMIEADEDVFEVVYGLNSLLGISEYYEKKSLKSQSAAVWEFISYLYEWRGLSDSASIDSFLRFYWGRHAQDDLNLDQESVKIMTVHGAKGLEAPYVFLVGADADTFPNKRSRLEEERRLFYVGMTRAIKELTICWAGEPSRFIKEAGL
jgi:DNA helicase-2/ATP-dependent DNA helicase PcrA